MIGIDINDSPFIAACLDINADGIWSFDRHFIKQKTIRVYTTKEIAGLSKG